MADQPWCQCNHPAADHAPKAFAREPLTGTEDIDYPGTECYRRVDRDGHPWRKWCACTAYRPDPEPEED
jgi:hypothetical protein